MLHDEGCIGNPTTVTDEMIEEMNRDLADVERCEAAITGEELEQMRQQEENAEWRKRWQAMCDRSEKRRKARERYQAKKAGKAVVA